MNRHLEIGAIRRSVSGGPLPSTRLISNIMQNSTPEKVDPKLNNLHMQFGQIVAHDIIFTPSASGKTIFWSMILHKCNTILVVIFCRIYRKLNIGENSEI